MDWTKTWTYSMVKRLPAYWKSGQILFCAMDSHAATGGRLEEEIVKAIGDRIDHSVRKAAVFQQGLSRVRAKIYNHINNEKTCCFCQKEGSINNS